MYYRQSLLFDLFTNLNFSRANQEPLHDHSEPISFVEGTADPAKPRSFDLNFSKGLPPSASILAALSESSNGQLRLEAPNRAARESLLLAIGIANYRGNLSSLSSETIFFSEDELSKEIDQKEARSNACPISTPSIISIGDDMTTNKPNVVCKKLDNISRQCSINESKLEDQLSEMRRLLESKDNFISELQQKLIKSR